MTSPRVLVIEDEFLIALDIKNTLSDAGFHVIGPAMTIDEALRQIEHSSIDVAVADGNLNGRSIGEIASVLLFRDIPLVLVSGYSRESLPVELAHAPLIEKPFNRLKLVETVRRLCVTAG